MAFMIPVFTSGNDLTIRFGGMSVSDAVRLKALEPQPLDCGAEFRQNAVDGRLIKKNW